MRDVIVKCRGLLGLCVRPWDGSVVEQHREGVREGIEVVVSPVTADNLEMAANAAAVAAGCCTNAAAAAGGWRRWRPFCP